MTYSSSEKALVGEEDSNKFTNQTSQNPFSILFEKVSQAENCNLVIVGMDENINIIESIELKYLKKVLSDKNFNKELEFSSKFTERLKKNLKKLSLTMLERSE